MNLTKFILLICEEKNKCFKRLDTLDVVSGERIYMVKQPSIILPFEHGSLLLPYIKKKKGFDIVTMNISKDGITKFIPEFYPVY